MLVGGHLWPVRRCRGESRNVSHVRSLSVDRAVLRCSFVQSEPLPECIPGTLPRTDSRTLVVYLPARWYTADQEDTADRSPAEWERHNMVEAAAETFAALLKQ